MAIIKSYTPSAEEAHAQRQWYIVDAEDKTLGRLSSKIAHILRGKHKPTFAPHMDMGDYVIVINAEKIHTAEGRLDSKLYRHHTKFQGGLKTITLRQQLIKHPVRPLEIAIKGMLPKNALGRQMFKKLKIYAGAEHPHTAQNPQPLEV